jgi:serine/threonine-protein kinase
MVFDQIGGSWVGVALTSRKCRAAAAEFWQVVKLQPRPDGTLTGEYTATAGNACAAKRTVTFTRTGDIDVNSLPDPASQPPRLVSPAEALRGHYHVTRTFENGIPQQQLDTAVSTDCLRTGDRCVSYFQEPSGDPPLVFSGGNWTRNMEADIRCLSSGETAHMKSTGQYPLPQPIGDPIIQLTGHGHQEQTAPCPINTDFNETFTRTGD